MLAEKIENINIRMGITFEIKDCIRIIIREH